MAIVITGGSRGIGFECARLFATIITNTNSNTATNTNTNTFTDTNTNTFTDTNTNTNINANTNTNHPSGPIILVSRQNAQAAAERLKTICQSNSSTPPDVVGVECNVADYKSVERLAEQVKQLTAGRGPRVLINAAGVVINGVLVSTPLSAIQQQVETNLLGTIYTCKLLGKQMLASSSQSTHRSIINVGSIVGRTGNAGQSVYSCTKSALVGLTRSLAKELGPRGIAVNMVAPGLIDTDMTAALSAQQKQTFLQQACIRRPGTVTDVANAIRFLTESTYITGQVLHVDGGIL